MSQNTQNPPGPRAFAAAKTIADFPHLMDLLACAVGRNPAAAGLAGAPFSEDYHKGVQYIAEAIDKQFPGYENLRTALQGMLDISHRLGGCPDETCSVCLENKAAIAAANAAILGSAAGLEGGGA